MKKAWMLITLVIICVIASPDYFVLNNFGETISSGTWLSALNNDIITVESIPNQILSVDGAIWVVSSGASRIQRFTPDETGLTLSREFALPAGSNPYLMYIFGNMVYTTLWVSGGIGIINTESGSVLATDPFCLGPQGIFADSSNIFVTAGNLDPIDFTYGPGQLWRLSPEGAPIDFLEIGTNPQQIIRGADGNLHIVCTGDYFSIDGVVYIVDPVSFTVIDSVNLGGWPQRLALDEYSGVVYSATSNWDLIGSGRLLAYDSRTHSLLWSAESAGNSLSGTGIVGLAAFENHVFLPSMDSSFVEICNIDRVTMILTRVARYTTGYGPIDVALVDETGIEENRTANPMDLLSISPSPFNGECFIRSTFKLEEVILFDLSGREIDRISIETILANDTKWAPDPTVPSGVYLVKAVGDAGSKIGRVVYIK